MRITAPGFNHEVRIADAVANFDRQFSRHHNPLRLIKTAYECNSKHSNEHRVATRPTRHLLHDATLLQLETALLLLHPLQERVVVHSKIERRVRILAAE